MAISVAGCGVESAQDDVATSVDQVRGKVGQVLGDIQPAIPSADGTSRDVRSDGTNEPDTIDGFLTNVIENVDGYWTKTLKSAGRDEPRVSYQWVPPGSAVQTGCGSPADENAAFYCPNDDTIYVGQTFASEVYNGTKSGFPGEASGGHAAGDFAVAYVLAHEYAHNVQQELGIFNATQSETAKPFELQADCLSGTWANSAYEEGILEPGDIEEGLSTALAIGDFEYGSAQHHGTPEERRDALLKGYESGDPSTCSAYTQQGV